MQKKVFFLLFFVGISAFSQNLDFEKSKDSIALLMKEYNKTNATKLTSKAFLVAERTKNDSLIRKTYINFGWMAYKANKDFANVALTEKKLLQLFKIKNDSFALAKYYHFKGTSFDFHNKSDSSFYNYSRSKDFHVLLKDSLEAGVKLLFMSRIQYRERDYLGCENSVVQGLRYIEPLEHYYYLKRLNNRLGNIMRITDRQIEARKLYLKAFEVSNRKSKVISKYKYAFLYNQYAKSFESEGNNIKGLEFYKKSLVIDSLINKFPLDYYQALDGYSYNSFKLGNKKLAIKGYLEVLKSREKRNDKKRLVFSHSLLGEVYATTKNVKKAIFHTKKGLALAKEVNNSERILENLLLLSKLVKGEKGRQYLEEHFILNDSLFKRERSLKNQFAKIRYETEKKDKENAGLKEENTEKQLLLEREKQQKTIGWFIAGISILVIGFGVSIASSRRKKILFDAKMQQIEAREKERQQIAKSLHDEVAGDIRMLHLKLAKTNQTEEAKSLDVIKENVRNLSHQLSSESFDKVSFKDQIINLISDFFEIDFRIKAEKIDSVDWQNINNAIKRTLFLTIRESVQNAKKHAAAKNVVLSFSETKKAVFLTISDNGKGFNVAAKKTGIGLKNMENKIRILIADDHQLVIQGILCSLKEVGDFDVVTTDNCDDAFQLIKSNQNTNPFQLLFTDLSFDNVTSETNLDGGEELIKAIKNNEFDIKIAVITGHTETNRVYNVISNLNPNAYLLKSKCDAAEIGFAVQKMLANDYYYTHEIHQKIMKRNIIQIQMDDVAIQIIKELPNHPKLANLEGVITKGDGSFLKLRSIETKLGSLRADLNANNNTDLVLKAKELGIID
ncbi:response regulator [Polaribacter sp. SA4-12]|uniref:response regulator n=1 Tax=Polaribacter sp. SA4-12 TaxID=1312072 RepID=UPI0012FA2763|nr:response regulator [Polaribacter sp. SA4-12]